MINSFSGFRRANTHHNDKQLVIGSALQARAQAFVRRRPKTITHQLANLIESR
jgi:hypothetical protein